MHPHTNAKPEKGFKSLEFKEEEAKRSVGAVAFILPAKHWVPTYTETLPLKNKADNDKI